METVWVTIVFLGLAVPEKKKRKWTLITAEIIKNCVHKLF